MVKKGDIDYAKEGSLLEEEDLIQGKFLLKIIKEKIEKIQGCFFT